LAVQCLFVYRKRKETSWNPSGKKGIFVGYCEVSKAFKIYIPGHRHIEISRDVTFDEEATLKKSRRCQLEEVYEEEPVNPRIDRINEGGSQSCRTSEGSRNFP
jgi:hypothetical protein